MNLSEMIDQMIDEERERLRLLAIEIRDEANDRNVLQFFSEDVDQWLEIRKRAQCRLTEEAKRIIAERPTPEPSYESWLPDFRYYYICDQGHPRGAHWHNQAHDTERRAASNIFKTIEDAEREACETAAWRRLKGLARMMNRGTRNETSYPCDGWALYFASESIGWRTRWYSHEALSIANVTVFYRPRHAAHAIEILRAEGHLDYLRPEGTP